MNVMSEAKTTFTVEQYQSELGEKAAKIVLEKMHGFRMEKVPEKKGKKSYDYIIKDHSRGVIAVCEVKSLVDTTRPIDFATDLSSEKEAELSKARDRNHRSKLMRHHDKAVSQLDGSGVPTLVIFVSFDMTDYIDMGQVLQDYKELYPASPMADFYFLMKIYQGIIPSNTFDIKYTPMILWNTNVGRECAEKYFSLITAVKNAGMLPITFKIPPQD